MKQTGILLIHGFAGTRDELMPLYRFLCGKGYHVAMPKLTGHEGSLRELSKSKHADWIKSAEDSFINLSQSCDKMIVIGFSMGGLIGVNLFKDYPFSKLITINTPVYYWDYKRIFQNLIKNFNKYSKKYIFASTNKPLPALLEFQRLLSKTKPLFTSLSCDALIIQTQDDDTVNIKSADYIYQRLRGNKSILKPKRGGHILFQSSHFHEVLLHIEHFIEKEK